MICFNVLLVYKCLDRVSSESQSRVQRVQETVIQTLQTLTAINHPSDVNLFSRLLMIITNFRELSIEYRQMFALIRDQEGLNDDVQSEILEILGLV
jgi:Ligand-binding domain of nuclear hormone receptor